MKKTLITLLALAGVAAAAEYTAEYTYVGAKNGWADDAENWVDSGKNKLADSGHISGKTSGKKFTISSGQSVKSGKNVGYWDGATVVVEAKSTLTFSSDSKLKNAAFVSEGTMNFGETYFDSNQNCGSATFDLGSAGIVKYTGKMHYDNADWNGNITLSAQLGEGYLEGTELTLFTRTLATFSEFTNKGAATDTVEGFITNHFIGGSITLGSAKLTKQAFDNTNLSTEDVGNYQLVYDETAKTLNVQYVAYENAAVPEPTTATLSLLALAGLAARRRR